MTMWLNSPAFPDAGAVPVRFTCDGENLSPPLEWGGAPAQARSFVILCEDPDAPSGLWRHWAAYDIPADRSRLPDGASLRAAELGFKQGVNDFRQTGYGGPCPPRGHGEHHYQLRLLALSSDHLPVGGRASCREVEAAARQSVLAETGLAGLYER
jgi:hypothetical protein